ncbi:endonuclease MutS2 [Fulvivirga sedimenti]|uniref:Endonuclease MutS2 n=1 Tax=Fulvivirga sedimenti TaxID=2879465 RepID=A0A9X1KWD5_9BACT|nr:endonuclease MutS2 [Fulvivirga sedimenti]MCA6073879.1 endonuclease MutS2 [Fulvivirga sedimenti]
MLVPQDIESKLGFDRIREILRSGCQSVQGSEQVDAMAFHDDHKRVKSLLGQTDEFVRILESGESFPLRNIHDLRDALKRAKTPGAFLEPVEFLEILQSMEAVSGVIRFLKGKRESYPELYHLVQNIEDQGTLEKIIRHVISDEGHVKNNASPELQRIRKALDQERIQLRKNLDKIFREAVKNGMVPEKASITVRDGRMVIPVLAEYKRRIKGFIHDESATGQTVYLEPAAVLDSNNELRELEYAEKREVVKILIRLTDETRIHLPALASISNLLGEFDFIRSKARLARELECTFPSFTDGPEFDVVDARHPLLFLNYRKSGRAVVPVSLGLNDQNRMIIISGPNAGGKSVSLKTVGLIQYMWQSGLLIPVDESSRIGLFKDIFLDIGDEQSIENDLSTYSSHLTLMKNFMENARRDSLVLIDEFGTGTDPQFGGAIAEGILDSLIGLGCRGIITTHYSNIKRYAEEHESVINGAMKYDVNELEPLYELQVGMPGSSFSFEVARKIGLPAGIISYARQLIGQKQVNVDELILKLEKQEQQIRSRDLALAEREKEAKELQEKYLALSSDLEKNKKEIIARAKEEASSLLKETNREIEKTIRHIKENKAEKKETKRMRERLETLKKKVNVPGDIQDPSPVEKVAPGDMVRLMGKDVVGEVLSIRGNNIEVQVGALKTLVKKNQLEKISKTEAKKSTRGLAAIRSNVDMNQKLAGFNHTLDIRGRRGDEALGLVDKFIDDAILFNANELRILHGKGDGILRTLIRNHLKSYPNVQSVRDEHVERGGSGITIAELK